jgi:hypothetical protein
VPLFLFFLKLPHALGIHMNGLVLLVVYMCHEQVRTIVKYGVSIHGLQIFPSYPSLVWAAGLPREWSNSMFADGLASVLQIIAVFGFVALFFQVVKLLCIPVFFVGRVVSEPLLRAGKIAIGKAYETASAPFAKTKEPLGLTGS